MPTTFAAFQTMLAKAVGEGRQEATRVLVIGNKDGYESLHAWGMIQGAYTPAQSVRDWIFHKPGATFDNATNTQSLNTLMKWVKAGYFGSDYNAVGENDAAAAFAKGKGIFYMGGNWQAQVIQAGLKGNAGFMDMPAGASGKVAAIGATSLAVAHLGQEQVPGRRRRADQLARSPLPARRSSCTPRTRSRRC